MSDMNLASGLDAYLESEEKKKLLLAATAESKTESMSAEKTSVVTAAASMTKAKVLEAVISPRLSSSGSSVGGGDNKKTTEAVSDEVTSKAASTTRSLASTDPKKPKLYKSHTMGYFDDHETDSLLNSNTRAKSAGKSIADSIFPDLNLLGRSTHVYPVRLSFCLSVTLGRSGVQSQNILFSSVNFILAHSSIHEFSIVVETGGAHIIICDSQ